MRLPVAAMILALVLAGCSPPPVPANDVTNEATTRDWVPRPSPGTAGLPARASQFSPIDDKSCRTVEQDAETGDWVGACAGVAGYELQWSISDLRDDLTIIDGKARTPLSIPAIVANGAFDSLGAKAEWRGRAGARPDVLVVRVHVANAEGKSDSGSLVVARLEPSPCIVAIVAPGAGQSERARAIADSALPDCLKA